MSQTYEALKLEASERKLDPKYPGYFCRPVIFWLDGLE